MDEPSKGTRRLNLRRMLAHTLLAGACIVGSAANAGPPASICPAPLQVGMSQLGQTFFMNGGVPSGTDVELLDELSHRLNLSYRIVDMTRARAFQSLEQGQYVDIVTSASQGAVSARAAAFAPTAVTRQYLVLSRRIDEPGLDLDRFMQNPALHLSVIAGGHFGPFLKARIEQLKQAGRVEMTLQNELLLPRLLAGRYDAVITTSATFGNARQIKAEDFRAVPIPEEPSFAVGFYLSRTRLSEACQATIAETIAAIHRDGTLLRINEHFFSPELARERVGFAPEATVKPPRALPDNPRR